jgi:hypothetical protein
MSATCSLYRFGAIAALGSLGWLWAPTVPADDGDIHACLNPGTGALRMVASSGDCRPSETAISWPTQRRNADPPCYDNENRYVDCGNGTVTDTQTQLVWLKDSDCFGPIDNYAEANQLAAALAHGQCGLTDHSVPGDWRLATQDEWRVTMLRARELGCTDADGTGPALTDSAGTACYHTEAVPLFTTVHSVYHSSSSRHNVPRNTLAAFVGTGGSTAVGVRKEDLAGNAYHVWPVRGGTSAVSHQLLHVVVEQ